MKVNNEIIKQLNLEKCSKENLTALYNFFELNAGVLPSDLSKNTNSKYLKNKKIDFGIGTIEYKDNEINFTKIHNETENNYVFFDFDLINKENTSSTILMYLKISAWCYKNNTNPFEFRVQNENELAFFGTKLRKVKIKAFDQLKDLGIEVEMKKTYRKSYFLLKVWNKQKTTKQKEVINVSSDWVTDLLNESEKANKNPNNLRKNDGWEE